MIPGEQESTVAQHQKGLMLALLGLTIFIFDSLLVRLIEADAWDLLFWRGALLSLTLILV
jgi:hypothetical protein